MRRASLALLVAAGCTQDDQSPERPGATDVGPGRVGESRSAGYVVDSVIPIEEALRRFRDGLGPVNSLSGGAPSRDVLVRRFVRAVEHGDTAALRRMELSRAEFAYLTYPSSPFTRPPYRQQPEIAWLLLRSAGDEGMIKLIERGAGHSLGYGGHECAPEPAVEGNNRLWRRCVVRYGRPDGTFAEGALFGVIVERGGQFKFASYANDL